MSDVTNITAVRKALCEALAKTFPQVKTVREHAGDFAETEINRILQNCPALHVAVLGFRPAEPTGSGGTAITLKCAVFMVTKDDPGISRDHTALNLASAVTAYLDRFVTRVNGVAVAQPAKNFAWQNLYSVTGQGKGTMLSALSFDVVTTLTRGFADDALLTLHQLYVGQEILMPEAVA
jgi:phage gp37-like protein